MLLLQELRDELEQRGMDASGLKAELVDRLTAAVEAGDQAPPAEGEAPAAAPAEEAPPAAEAPAAAEDPAGAAAEEPAAAAEEAPAQDPLQAAVTHVEAPAPVSALCSVSPVGNRRLSACPEADCCCSDFNGQARNQI